MMRFNRAISAVKVISFDLDDTLYDNRPIIKNAIKAGANESSVEVIDFEEIYLAYMPGNAVRLRVKAAGELRA